jgi:hypothetical protein
MALRPEAEVREKLAELRRRRDLNPKRTGVLMLHARVEALEWVLGEAHEEDDEEPLVL